MTRQPASKNSIELLFGWAEENAPRTRLASVRAQIVAQNRSTNIRELLGHFPTAKEFHKATGVSMSLLSNLQRGATARPNSKSIGETVARRIEVALHLPKHWMDRKNDRGESRPEVSVDEPQPVLADDGLYATRVANLALLLRHFGSARDLARHSSLRGEHISSIKGWGSDTTGKSYRRMGEWVARGLELALNLPEYWMDQSNDGGVPELNMAVTYGSDSPAYAQSTASLLLLVSAPNTALELPELD